jgi:hypothetical protein
MSYIGKTPTSVPLTSSDITDGIISLPKLTDGTDGNLISYDASGNPVAVATGTDGQVLTSTGAGSPPAFETLPTNTPAFLAYLGSNQNPSDETTTDVTIDTEVFDVGSCFNTGTYTFTPNVAGKYLLFAAIRVGSDTSRPAFIQMQARITKNGGNCANQLLSSYSVSNLDAYLPITTIVEANGSSDAFKVDTYLDADAGTITITAGQHQTYFGGYKIIE